MKIVKDQLGLFPQIKDYVQSAFKVPLKIYAYGSRTRERPCNKCDFDLSISVPDDYEELVKILQAVGIYGLRSYRKKVQQKHTGRSISGIDYLKRVLEIYISEVKGEMENYFSFTKDEYNNKVSIDVGVRYVKKDTSSDVETYFVLL